MLLTLLFFHLIAAVSLFAGIAIEIAGYIALLRARNVAEVRAAVTCMPAVGPIMISAVVLLVAMGISMVYVSGFGWQPWIVFSLGVTVVLTAIGKTVNGARCEAIHAAAFGAADGSIPDGIERARRDPVLAYCIFAMLFELVAALYIMTNKPQLNVCAIAAAIAAMCAFVPAALVRRAAPRTVSQA